MTTNEEKYQEISINQLRFDPDNPRLPKNVNGKNDAEIIKRMLEKANLIELMLSIAEQGYFAGELLLVVPSGDNNYCVIEGNRRLAATKLLLDPKLALTRSASVIEISNSLKSEDRESLKKLPVLIFKDRNDILYYLGYRHITGVETWGALAKARYLDQLFDYARQSQRTQSLFPDNENINNPIIFKELAQSIGSRADYVAKILTGFAIYKKLEEKNFFDTNIDIEESGFSLLTTALGYKNIPKFLGLENNRDVSLEGLNISSLQELVNWMFVKSNGQKTKLGESRNLGLLDNVLSSDIATQKLREGFTLQEANNWVSSSEEAIFENLLQKVNEQLKACLRNVPTTIESSRYNNFTDSIEETWQELKEVLRQKKLPQ
jgi:hypothetical protein